MVRRGHTPEQIIRKLREADRPLGQGARSRMSPGTWRRPSSPITSWRNQFGGMKADDARWLKDL